MTIVRFDANVTVDQIVKSLDENGYCIVERLMSDSAIESVRNEMAPYLAADQGKEEGDGHSTARLGSLITRSPASHQFIAHPLVMAVCEKYFPSTTYQLNLGMMNVTSPGSNAQFLHRDELVWDAFPFPVDYHVELGTIWAMEDFTEENGATRIIPGSHKHNRPTTDFTQADTIAAEMPKGSMIIYSGKLVHGAGANRSSGRRIGMLIDYCVGWLRQEENHYLGTPPEVAAALDPVMQRLLGYQWGAPGLGYINSHKSPLTALGSDADNYPKWMPANATDHAEEKTENA